MTWLKAQVNPHLRTQLLQTPWGAWGLSTQGARGALVKVWNRTGAAPILTLTLRVSDRAQKCLRQRELGKWQLPLLLPPSPFLPKVLHCKNIRKLPPHPSGLGPLPDPGRAGETTAEKLDG